jgi:hypothetical protein
MAKIEISIEGKSLSLKVDGNEVADLSGFNLSFYKCSCCDCNCENGNDVNHNDVYFTYDVRPKTKDGDFNTMTSYRYCPAKASFEEGVGKIDIKNPTKEDYKGI